LNKGTMNVKCFEKTRRLRKWRLKFFKSEKEFAYLKRNA